MIIQILCD